jgi:hypothetical protein
VGLQKIGHGGQPLPTVFRRVHPPVTVLIDLAAMFPREPHGEGRYHPNGLQMGAVAEGVLTCWGMGEHGGWWGLVTYPVRFGGDKQSVTHWAPAWVLKVKRSGGSVPR